MSERPKEEASSSRSQGASQTRTRTLIIKSSSQPIEVKNKAQKDKSSTPTVGSTRFPKRTPAVLEPEVFGQGVTGADLSLPVFDGTSTDPEDYLIDLETDSMETAPDVRIYFHLVGELSQEATTPPVDLEERKVYDSRLVRQGREYLQAARARGHGLYLLADRDLLAYNVPGGPWYRMPLTGIVNAFFRREYQPTKEEGGFMLDPDEICGVESTNTTSRNDVLLTNIRSTIWWGDTLRPGVTPGTQGWDTAIYSIYYAYGHPSSIIWTGSGRDMIVDGMSGMNGRIVQGAKAREIVKRDWYRREDYHDYGWGEEEEEDEPDSTENRLIFDPAFLAEIQPAKSRGFFKRGK